MYDGNFVVDGKFISMLVIDMFLYGILYWEK